MASGAFLSAEAAAISGSTPISRTAPVPSSSSAAAAAAAAAASNTTNSSSCSSNPSVSSKPNNGGRVFGSDQWSSLASSRNVAAGCSYGYGGCVAQRRRQGPGARINGSSNSAPRAAAAGLSPNVLGAPVLQGGGLGSEFCGNKSTRLVSKVHWGRQKSYNGKHSPVAAMAVQDVMQSSSYSGIWGSLEKASEKLAGAEDLPYILRELGNKGEWEKALKSFEWMVMQERVRGQWSKLASIMISTLGRLGKVEIAEKVFYKVKAAGFGDNVYVYSALISAYGRCGKCVKALEVFECMKRSGCKPNLITYNTIIDACGKGGGNLSKALEIFEEMQRGGVEPDRITFNSLIAVCGRGNFWEQAQRLFLEMQQRGIEQDIFTYNTLVDSFCKGGQVQLAASMVPIMRLNSIPPNVVTYSTLIDGYAKMGCFDEAISLYHDMKAMGIYPDRVSYNNLLDIYARLGKFVDALAVCDEMEKAGWKKDVVTYNALLDSYGKQGKYKEAKNMFERMKEEKVAPNVLTYSTLIDGFAKGGFHEDAMRLFQEFKQAGLKPDVVLYSALIDAHCKNGSVEEALALLEEMNNRGIQPNVVTYNSLIDAYGRRCLDQEKLSALDTPKEKQGHMVAAANIFNEMQRFGVKPNVVTFSAILNACSRCGSFEEASILLETMRLFDGRVYGVACGLLMGLRKHVWGHAELLFDQITILGHNTAAAFYNALTDMLWHFDQRAGAQEVVTAAKHRRVWEKAWWHSGQQLCLDLHLMSVGAAQAMLHMWLLHIHAIIGQGHDLPRSLSILTGWGRHSKVQGDCAVKRAIEARLLEIGAPFHVAKFNEGRLVSAGHTVGMWMTHKKTLSLLVLHDIRNQAGKQEHFSSLLAGGSC